MIETNMQFNEVYQALQELAERKVQEDTPARLSPGSGSRKRNKSTIDYVRSRLQPAAGGGIKKGGRKQKSLYPVPRTPKKRARFKKESRPALGKRGQTSV
jgi:hypothetical protein